jgi:hypothetical protein
MIVVEHPRHVSTDEAESWLRQQLEAIGGEGIERVELKRLGSPALRFSEARSWMIQLECRDPASACEAVKAGAGLERLADMRLLGMRPWVATVEDVPRWP